MKWFLRNDFYETISIRKNNIWHFIFNLYVIYSFSICIIFNFASHFTLHYIWFDYLIIYKYNYQCYHLQIKLQINLFIGRCTKQKSFYSFRKYRFEHFENIGLNIFKFAQQTSNKAYDDMMMINGNFWNFKIHFNLIVNWTNSGTN